MRRGTLAGIMVILLSIICFTPRSVFAEIEWTVKKQLKLEAAPTDVAQSRRLSRKEAPLPEQNCP